MTVSSEKGSKEQPQWIYLTGKEIYQFFNKVKGRLQGITVYALVGKSGTGKSFRAKLLAEKIGIPYIMDDGLLIHESTILAGRSAKQEKNYISAIKTALISNCRARVKRSSKNDVGEKKEILLQEKKKQNVTYTFLTFCFGRIQHVTPRLHPARSKITPSTILTNITQNSSFITTFRTASQGINNG